MMEFDKLPKGMKIPEVELEVEKEVEKITSMDVDYSKAIRSALKSIFDVDIVVRHMTTVEEEGRDPEVTLKLIVKAKDKGDAND